MQAGPNAGRAENTVTPEVSFEPDLILLLIMQL